MKRKAIKEWNLSSEYNQKEKVHLRRSNSRLFIIHSAALLSNDSREFVRMLQTRPNLSITIILENTRFYWGFNTIAVPDKQTWPKSVSRLCKFSNSFPMKFYPHGFWGRGGPGLDSGPINWPRNGTYQNNMKFISGYRNKFSRWLFTQFRG